MDEIDTLLEDEILPTIEKLRKERGDYMKWAAGNDSLERLRRFCVAYEFTRCVLQLVCLHSTPLTSPLHPPLVVFT